ncbi:hypothetical protein [Pelagibius sp.]|uniref:hypothetical protein n=1 Tax=Pelagibius sp. TaxID=1931238 RepID=UPI00261807DA|nr:hypothetical protein [Pelagibius sp.]
MQRIVGALMLGLWAGACAPTVQSNVEIFHALPSDYVGESITILASDEKEARSLEFKSYAERLAGKLQEVGFRVVGETEGPRFVAFLGYAIGKGQQITRSYSIPNIGVTGYSSSQTYGTVHNYGGYGTYSGTTTYTPQYGVTGYSTGTTTETVYPRAVVIHIYEVNWSDIENSPQVYSLTIGSSGGCGILSQVIDEMLEAGFQGFPGESGSARKARVDSNANC